MLLYFPYELITMTVNDSALLKTGFAAGCAAVRSGVRQPIILADPFKLSQALSSAPVCSDPSALYTRFRMVMATGTPHPFYRE